MEREDLSIVKGWDNDVGIMGEYEPIVQETRADLERQYDKLTEAQCFFIEKKDGTRIGLIAHFATHGSLTGIKPCADLDIFTSILFFLLIRLWKMLLGFAFWEEDVIFLTSLFGLSR
jgi:hypothetical protein